MKPFELIRVKKPKRAAHDLSHEKKLTMNMADLVPIFLQETLPGDTFKVNTEMLIRLQPLISPAMHRINAYVHFFFVPNRLIWDDWQEFITGGMDGKQTPNHPKFIGTHSDWYDSLAALSSDTQGIGTLPDYMGIPVNMYKSGSSQVAPSISQLPFRAYQLIYNQYYRDENLIPEVDIPTDSVDIAVSQGIDDSLFVLRKRCWEKDYFTSALPWAQRGDSVLLPLMGNAPVSGKLLFKTVAGDLYPDNQTLSQANGSLHGSVDSDNLRVRVKNPSRIPPETEELTADLSEASATSITDLRRSFAIQRWLERNARSGYRYIEQILAHFGVKSSDARLQRAEYLGGGKMPIRIGEVLQTSQSDETPQGTMAGHGISGGNIMGFKRFFEEHGYIIGILSVIPRSGYYQGLPKIFSKFDKFDYFFPEFAHIGEQPILSQEVFLDEHASENSATFGYQRRYADYCYTFDSVHGQMRTSMMFWHLNRDFNTVKPTLSSQFVECDPSTRVFAITDIFNYGQLIVQLYNNTLAIRPVPKFGDPI